MAGWARELGAQELKLEVTHTSLAAQALYEDAARARRLKAEVLTDPGPFASAADLQVNVVLVRVVVVRREHHAKQLLLRRAAD